jgi:hypothetical protein
MSELPWEECERCIATRESGDCGVTGHEGFHWRNLKVGPSEGIYMLEVKVSVHTSNFFDVEVKHVC